MKTTALHINVTSWIEPRITTSKINFVVPNHRHCSNKINTKRGYKYVALTTTSAAVNFKGCFLLFRVRTTPKLKYVCVAFRSGYLFNLSHYHTVLALGRAQASPIDSWTSRRR